METDTDDSTPHQVNWRASFRRLDTGEDVDTTAHDYTTADQDTDITVPDTVGKPAYGTITFSDGANMDNIEPGEMFGIRLWRDPTDPADNAVNDAYLWRRGLAVREQ